MSKCMTIADETIDQKDICLEIGPKEIVEIILEEALFSALIVSDKGCSQIGDSNITDEFYQQYDQLSNQKDFEQVENSQPQPAANKDSNFNFRENLDRTALQARENLEQIIDSFVKEEEKSKPLNECRVISEEVLAGNELQIKNGQIHLESNKTQKIAPEYTRPEYFDKKDIIKDEKIEIEYFNEGQLNKIYVPLNLTNGANTEQDCKSKEEDDISIDEKKEEIDKEVVEDDEEKEKEKKEEENLIKEDNADEENSVNEEKAEKENSVNEEKADEENTVKEKAQEDTERPFKPFTTEDLRQTTLQIWENDNSSLVGRWDGDMLAQRDKVVKIIKELSSVHVFSDSFTDPNRPRACTFGEEDVEKMTKEIEDINFTVNHGNSEASVSYYLDGQGDVDLESEKKEKLQQMHVKDNAEKDQNQFKEVIQNQITQNSPNYISDIDFKNEDILYDENIEIKSSTEMKTFPLDTSQPNVEQCMNRINSELFRKDSGNMKKENITKSTDNIPKKKESLSETNPDLITLKDLDMTPDLEMKLLEKEPSAQDVPDMRESLPNLTGQTRKGTLSWNGLQWKSKEAVCTLNSNAFLEEKHWETISVQYTEDPQGKSESNDAEHFLQESQLERCKSNFGIIQNGEDANLNAEKTNEKLEETLIYAKKNVESFEKLEGKISEEGTDLTEKMEPQHFINDNIFNFSQTSLDPQDSQITLSSKNKFGSSESNEELPVSSQSSQNQINDESTQENELSEGSEALVSGSQKFKLHSPKMYLTPYHEPAGQVPNDFNLTESEEAFIDVSENVIQIIDPPENSADEDSNEVSFSLLSETPNSESVLSKNIKVDAKSESFLIEKDLSESETPPKKVYSGMTTIGPIKNIDHDPKDLTAPEIDYGKMTRITSSRQLARDMALLNSENPALSVKIIEEDDSDDDTSLNFEDEHVDRNSLVNRDIASLTKVQKIREVMSHQAKPEEDFEDEDSLPRPRLDLKDVESMTDERYKFPDVSMPLLSFEIGDRNIDAEKELIESMGLIISGLTNACFYEEEVESNAELQTNNSASETDNITVELSEKLEEQNSKTGSLSVEEVITTNIKEEKITTESIEDLSVKEVLNRKDSLPENSEYHKYSTLGNVFRKASGKFLRKDSELCMRTTKSLPRDTNRIPSTNSIRSILDECQSSASSMLKKSCSLLKNTENIFKSISQSMVTSDRSSSSNTTQKKLSPSESDVSTMEKKFSGFLKKEDFTKAKNLLKSKVEKTFKIYDKESTTSCEPQISSEKEELRLAVRKEENLRIDRIENFKKLLPKSPLVYKSQFVKSQMSFQSSEPEKPEKPESVEPEKPESEEPEKPESEELEKPESEKPEKPESERPEKPETERPEKSESEPPQKPQTLEASVNPPAPEKQAEESGNPFEECNSTESIKEKELKEFQETEINPRDSLQWIGQKEDSPLNETFELQQPDFIVMETIQGLPASDLESPSSEKENKNVENSVTEAEQILKKIEAPNPLQINTPSNHDIAPHYPEIDEEKTAKKTPSEGKVKTKKKKFTARFRSFWCSAFGRAKSPTKKGDLS